MTEVNNSANWTQFPLAHPTPFTLILLECSPEDLLSCRATCTTWFSWFTSSSTIWTKYHSTLCTRLAPAPIGYRLTKLLEVPITGEADAFVFSVKMHRALQEDESVMNQETLRLMRAIEKWSPVLAPPSVFIRLKVNHPAVTKVVLEVLDRYLGCILVDKKSVLAAESQDEVRRLMSRNMLQHQFAYIDFVKRKAEPSVDTSGSLVLEGEDKLEEALKLSMEAAEVFGKKRKRIEMKKTENKRIKLDSENGGEDDNGGSMEKHDNEANPESIYAVKETTNPEFPTMLELLSIDQPLVEELLIKKYQIDTSLIVPQFDEFLHHPGLLASDKLLVGCDSDGKVASVRPQAFCQDGGAFLGSIENPMSMRRDNKVEFWGGKDIRYRWPEFAKQLDNIDKKCEGAKEERPKGSKLNLPVMVPTLSMEKRQEAGNDNTDNTAGSSDSSNSVPDLMQRLAARGVSVQRK